MDRMKKGRLCTDKDLLDDLAVATATGDYFFMEKSEDNSSFTFSNLDKNKGYKFYAFGSRLATQVRTAIYIISGENTDQGELQAAGTNCGGTGMAFMGMGMNAAGNVMGGFQQPVNQQPQQQAQSQEDPYEKLAKLKKLLDDGVISQEEFDEAKKKILGV